MPDAETLREEQQLVEVEARELLAYYKSRGMGEPVMVARLANEVERLRTQNQTQPTAGSSVSTLIGYEAGYSDGRDACVELVKAVGGEVLAEIAAELRPDGSSFSVLKREAVIKLLGRLRPAMESLTLDQVQEKR